MHTIPDPDSPQTTIERITLLYAMEAEGMPLVERLKLTEQPAVDPNLTQRHFAGTVGTVSIVALIALEQTLPRSPGSLQFESLRRIL